MLERLLDLIAEDWTLLQTVRRTLSETQTRLRARVTQALALGVGGRGISRRTNIPEANVRRWAVNAGTDGQGSRRPKASELVRTLGADGEDR